MINTKAIGFTIAFAIVGTMLLITGCGGGGGASYPTPGLPANAVVFDSFNATDIANRAVSDSGYVGTSARQAKPLSSLKAVMELASDQIRSTDQSSSITTGASQTIVIDCTDDFIPSSGGNITITVNGDESSATGSLTFNSCTFDGIVTVNGSISFDGTGNNAGDFNFNGGGSITITDTSNSTSITMVMRFSESVNDFDGTFKSSFSFSIEGLPDGGFLVETTQPLVGDMSGVTAGQIMISGGNGTRIRIDITGLNMADVFLDINDGNGFQDHSSINF